MNKEEFIKEIEKLGLTISDDILKNLTIYLEFLKNYNQHTNLTAITSDNDILLKHFYDSLTIIKAVDPSNIESLLDIGSGAGFPGMVLKIFYPNLKVTLIDSNNKKTKFLKELALRMNVDVKIINDRVEDFAKNNLNKYDIVTSRAVANMRVLSELSLPLVKKDGLFIALKGNIAEELDESKQTIELMGGKIERIISFKLYDNNGNRNIVVVQKKRDTRINELRPYDKIIKNPLQKKFN